MHNKLSNNIPAIELCYFTKFLQSIPDKMLNEIINCLDRSKFPNYFAKAIEYQNKYLIADQLTDFIDIKADTHNCDY